MLLGAVQYHLQKLPRDADNWVVRVFEEPIGPLDPETGQPWKAYAGVGILTVLDSKPEEAEVQALVSVPWKSFFLLRNKIARVLNLKSIFGYRWHDKAEPPFKERIELPIRT